MEAYLQEILYITFAEGLDRKVRTKILQLAEIFPAILERPFLFWMLQLPQPPGGDSSKPATRRSMERIVGNDGGSLLAFGTSCPASDGKPHVAVKTMPGILLIYW